MDIRVLRYCEAVARLGNITRAAAEMHVAQPVLSIAIRKLAEELGVTLFTRTRNKPVSLTPEGQILMRRAVRLFHEFDWARRELARTDRVADSDLDALPMILFEGSFLQRSVLEQRCQRANVRFTTVMETNSVPIILQAVLDGLGAATLLRSIVKTQKHLVALSFEPREHFRFDLCWLNDHYLSKANEPCNGSKPIQRPNLSLSSPPIFLR